MSDFISELKKTIRDEISQISTCLIGEVESINGTECDLQTDKGLLIAVPIFFPNGITYPINAGDKLLVIFSQTDIDKYFGGEDLDRQYDLSDGMAIPIVAEQTNNYTLNITKNGVLLKVGNSIIEMTEQGININATQVKINNVDFTAHTHTSGAPGTPTSPPMPTP